MQEEFKDVGKALIRTPLYSWGELFGEDGKTIELECLVSKRLNDPVFLEALYWSSPQLYARVQKFKSGNLEGEKQQNLLHALKKYLIRAHTRATPYGIFAGTGLVNIDEPVDSSVTNLQRSVKVDSALLQNILQKIETDPEIYPHLRYSLNNTLYRIPGQFRFTEKIKEQGKISYQLSSMEVTPLLEKIVDFMADKKLSAREIFEKAVEDEPFEIFIGFFDELIKSQFLVSELQQAPTFNDEVSAHVKTLKRIAKEGNQKPGKYLMILQALERVVDNFSTLAVGALPLNEMREIKEQLNELKIESCQDHLFHANLKKMPLPGFVLGSDQVTQIKKGVNILRKLSPAKEKKQDYLDSFKTLFEKKYGPREIPLSEALDPEYGIAFPPGESIGNTLFNSLIEKVKHSVINEYPAERVQKTDLTYFAAVEEVRISDADIPPGEYAMPETPSSFSVMGSILPSGQILMEGVGKAHANALSGRFSDLDPRTYKLCRQLAADEQRKNEEVVFAEIVFQPAGRTGNITRRPSFFEYEIPYLSAAFVAQEMQIPVSDLLLSVRNNELIIRSARLNKRIIPRLSNAHNFAASTLPVYQFLSFLQYPTESTVEINWGNTTLKRSFLPRVTYGNLILHRARWFLHQEDISFITAGPSPIGLLKEFISKWKVARFVSLAEGDNELFIDTLNLDYLQLLLTEIQKRSTIILVEWLFGFPVRGIAHGGCEIEQFILPLIKNNGKRYHPFSITDSSGKRIRQTFVPGSEWMYFKIYCSAAFSDKILLEVVKPAVDHLVKENVISKAFFVRYTDPHYHLRFRLQLLENWHQKGYANTLSYFYNLIQPFSVNGVVWKIQSDTYRRETERYGEESIKVTEEAFFYDSRLFLCCLGEELFEENDEARFLTAVKNLDQWLSLFRLPLEEKVTFCEAMGEKFSKEFGREARLKIDSKYRELSNELPNFFDSFIFDREFAEREDKLLQLRLPQKNLGSYIHMSMNRWFVTEQRLMEYMCYVFAGKYYKQVLHYHCEK